MVSIDLTSLVPAAIVFQYNPDTLTRQLEARGSQGDAAKGDALRLNGAP